MKELRIACCGGGHSHAKDFPMDRAPVKCAGLPYRFVAVWDDDPVRGPQWAEEMHCPYQPDFDRICADPEIDAVIITCGTTRHASLAIRAAEAGKHIFIEKALAADPAEARAIRDAVKKSGIHFTISDPVEKPELVFAKKLMDEGVFGEVTEVRYRAAHGYGVTDPGLMSCYYTRSEAGGGAMFDMGHHAVHVLRWFLGLPDQAVGVFSRFSDRGKKQQVDDIGTAVYHFPSGAIGIAETGWLSPAGGASLFELHGTKGFLQWSRGEFLRYQTAETEGWVNVTPDQLPEPPVYPLRYWMESILEDTFGSQYGVDEAVEVCEMIAAAYELEDHGARIEYQ